MDWNSRILDMLLLQEAKNQNVILPMKPKEERGTLQEKVEYQGAYRELFEKGSHFNITEYDLSSCYPSMIVDFCLDPANILQPNYKGNQDIINIENKEFIQNPNTLLPTVTKKLMNLKNEIKVKLEKLKIDTIEYKDTKKLYDAIKSITNSAYGVFANRFFRLFSTEVASATTFLVRDLLHYVLDELKVRNYKTIYVDTDGIFVDCEEDISNLLNQLIKDWGKKKYNKDSINIEFSYKGKFEKILLLTLCRYRGFLRKPNGELEEETKGLEIKRKDSTKYLKEFQEKLFDKILEKGRRLTNEEKETIINWVKDEIQTITNKPLQDIAFPCKLSKTSEEYKNKPIFVRALENTPEFDSKIGNNFYYIYVKPQEEPEIKTVIKIKGNLEETDGVSYGDIILSKNLNRKEGIEYARKQWKQNELDTKLIRVLHKKEKHKNVLDFDEENYEYIDKFKIDWERIIERNILNKAEVIFDAMDWDMKKVLNMPKKTPKSSQNKKRA